MNYQKENVDFLESQIQAQEKLYPIIDKDFSARLITLIGENGSGKTNFASFTSPYKRTIYINFEYSGSANMAKILSDNGLIKYVEYHPNQSIQIFLNKILKNLEIAVQNKEKPPIKVLIIDSIGELISREIEIELKTNVDKYHYDSGALCSKKTVQMLNIFYKAVIDLGITVIQLCGINEPNDRGELGNESFQIQTNVMKEWIRKTSNAIYMIVDTNREGKYAICKDNAGLNQYNLSNFFLSRKLVINSLGQSAENLLYTEQHFKENKIISYGITNILSIFANRYNDFSEELKARQMLKNSIKEYVENTN
ncbi:MAG: hypothetical protein RLZZ418_291 [Pseudomonadota bacterium]|jgi:hypothetical protein